LGHNRIEVLDSDVKRERRNLLIKRFAPKANMYETDEPLDLLISTDCISEGQNLQDGQVVINYDLHWNPVRLVQRIGRIDRIGSPHKEIFVYNFYPEDALEDLLGLMQRLHEKLEEINRNIGLDSSILGERPNPKDFNAIRRLSSEDKSVLDELEAESELLIGEFLMQDLLDYLRKIGEEYLQKIPTGITLATGMKAKREKGIFAAFYYKNLDAHYWLFMNEQGKIIDRKLQAIQHIRCDEREPTIEPDTEKIYPLLLKMRKELVNSLRKAAHKPPELPSPQREIVRWLQAQPPSAIRNELLSYFSHPLPDLHLKELRKLWRERTRFPDPQKLMKAIKEFSENHPVSPVRQEREIIHRDINEDDIEIIGWVALM